MCDVTSLVTQWYNPPSQIKLDYLRLLDIIIILACYSTMVKSHRIHCRINGPLCRVSNGRGFHCVYIFVYFRQFTSKYCRCILFDLRKFATYHACHLVWPLVYCHVLLQWSYKVNSSTRMTTQLLCFVCVLGCLPPGRQYYETMRPWFNSSPPGQNVAFRRRHFQLHFLK